MRPDTILNRTATFILAGGRGERLDPLTRGRSKPAVPFGDRCIIDFTLANTVNSGLPSPFILTQYEAESLHRHVHRWWSGNSTQTPAACLPASPSNPYRGTADAIYKNLQYLAGMDLVLVLSADHIYEMDYRKLIDHHLSCKADVTISSIVFPAEASSQFGIMQVDPSWRVVGFQEKPRIPQELPGRPGEVLANMGIYVFKASILKTALMADAADASSSHDFGKNILPKLVETHHVHAFSFEDGDSGRPGYWKDVGTLDAYYEASMKWLQDVRRAEALNRPASVLSRRARIHRSAVVQDSVVMPGVRIGRGSSIHRAIIDENVYIPEGTRIGFDFDADSLRFRVTPGGVVVIPADTVVDPMPRRAEKTLFVPRHAAHVSL